MKSALAASLAAAAMFLCMCAPANAHSLKEDARWSGRVVVEGQLVVEERVTLTIEPGTVVVFVPGKLDEEGLADSGLLVKGTIVAAGQPDARISFTSGAEKPKPGDWGEVKLFGSQGSAFKDCDFTYGGWGLHIHNTDIKIEDCTFTKNTYGGVRLMGGQVEISGCTMSGMEIGIRFWKGAPSIHHNTITGNQTGIFCRQDGGGASIMFNNVHGNTEYDMKLGDAQKEDVDARYNWWGTVEPARIAAKIYDKGREDYIGRVVVEPVMKKEVAPIQQGKR